MRGSLTKQAIVINDTEIPIIVKSFNGVDFICVIPREEYIIEPDEKRTLTGIKMPKGPALHIKIYYKDGFITPRLAAKDTEVFYASQHKN